MLQVIIVFVSVFTVVALVMVASRMGATERTKQTLARLDAVLVAESRDPRDELIDVRKKELLSTIPLLNRVLLQLELTPRIRTLLYQADLRLTTGGLLLMTITAWFFSSYLIYLKTGSFLGSAMLGLIPGAVPLGYVFYKRNKRFQAFEEALPGAIDLMVNALRGGHSLVSAIELVGKETPDPVGKEFRICFDEQNYGLDLRAALTNLSIRIPLQDVRIMRTAIVIQKESGGNVAEVLDKCAYVIRERFRLRREIRVKTAQGRLTGLILGFLPVVLGILLFFVNPEGVSLLWRQPLGQKMLYTGVILTLIGALVIRKIVRVRV